MWMTLASVLASPQGAGDTGQPAPTPKLPPVEVPQDPQLPPPPPETLDPDTPLVSEPLFTCAEWNRRRVVVITDQAHRGLHSTTTVAEVGNPSRVWTMKTFRRRPAAGASGHGLVYLNASVGDQLLILDVDDTSATINPTQTSIFQLVVQEDGSRRLAGASGSPLRKEGDRAYGDVPVERPGSHLEIHQQAYERYNLDTHRGPVPDEALGEYMAKVQRAAEREAWSRAESWDVFLASTPCDGAAP